MAGLAADLERLPLGPKVLADRWRAVEQELGCLEAGFEHDPEESVRVRVRLLREAAASGELLVATHLPFPSVGHVAIKGDAFRWVAAFWDY